MTFTLENYKLSKEEILDALKNVWNYHMPFGKLVGTELIDYDTDFAKMRIKMNEHLKRDIHTDILHGGAIATLLDMAGGIVALANLVKGLKNTDFNYLVKKLEQCYTVDIHINYILPGRGEEFIADAKLIRSGNKVVVVQSHLYNEKSDLIALSNANYIIADTN